MSATVQDMGVDHGCTYIRMPKQILHGAYVVARPQQIGCETMPQGVRRHFLVYASIPRGLPDRPLNPLFFDVMALNIACAQVG